METMPPSLPHSVPWEDQNCCPLRTPVINFVYLLYQKIQGETLIYSIVRENQIAIFNSSFGHKNWYISFFEIQAPYNM